MLRLLLSKGWQRLIGSPKLQIVFHKRATKYRSFLRKMTYKDKGSYESSPPCSSWRFMNAAMGWLRLVGSLKLEVSFAKEPYKRDDILQKRPIMLRSLLIADTPYYSYHVVATITRLLKIIGLFRRITSLL